MELKLPVGRVPDPVEYLAVIEEVVVLGWEHDCEGSVSKLSHKQNVGVRIPRTPPPPPPTPSPTNHWSSRLSQPITGHPVYRSQSLVIPCIAANLWSSRLSKPITGHPVYRSHHWSSHVSQPITGHPVYRSQSLVIPSIAANLWSSRQWQPITGHPVYCSQSLVIPTMAANHWSSRLLQLITVILSITAYHWSGHPPINP
jgi:hypothetical protein